LTDLQAACPPGSAGPVTALHTQPRRERRRTDTRAIDFAYVEAHLQVRLLAARAHLPTCRVIALTVSDFAHRVALAPPQFLTQFAARAVMASLVR